mgnify:CR=1 FL=1
MNGSGVLLKQHCSINLATAHCYIGLDVFDLFAAARGPFRGCLKTAWRLLGFAQKQLGGCPAHWFKYAYGTPKKMSAAFPILKLYNFNISIL